MDNNTNTLKEVEKEKKPKTVYDYKMRKKYIYKWRENNKDSYNEYCRIKFNEYYERNKVAITHKRWNKLYIKNELEDFRNMCLPEL